MNKFGNPSVFHADVRIEGKSVLAGETDITGTLKKNGVTWSSTAAEMNALNGVTAGTVTASKAVVVGTNKNIDVIAIVDLKLGAGAGTSVTSTAAELNLLDTSVAGTAVASKALVLGTDKNVDVLAVADLKLGAAAGTSVTSTAVELNTLAAVVAGTVSASKAVVVGTNKNVDVLAVADLKLGAGAGTSVTATAAEINTLASGTAIKKITQTVLFSEFTDGGATAGTFNLTTQIPVLATVLCSKVKAITGFAGDTSAVLTIGDGTDADRYNTGTLDVFSTLANGIATGIPSGVQYHDTAKTVTLTVTTNADFTSVNAGSLTVEIDYIP